MNERWDLSILYDGFDDGRYASDLAALSAAAEELAASLDGTIHWDKPLGEAQYG